MKTAFLSALAAMLLIAPAAASAAPQVTAGPASIELESTYDPSGAFDPADDRTFESAVTITNTGDVNLLVVEAYLGGEPPQDPFVLVPDPFGLGYGNCSTYNPGVGLSTQFLLGSGESCQFHVRFSPLGLSEGLHTETLKLKARGMPGPVDGNSVEIPISANVARNSAVSVSTNELNLGSVPKGSTSTRTVTVTSTGTAPVFMNQDPQIKLPDGNYPLASPFAFSRPGGCAMLDPGQSCDIEVSFTPKNSSSYTSDLWIYGSFGTIKIRLTGSGVDPQAEVTPNIKFGEKIIGSRSTAAARITASSFTAINVDSAAITGPGASSYSLGYDPGKCQGLDFQKSCEFKVTFRPTTTGSHEASLVLTGNFGSRTIKLSGSARKATPAKLFVRVFGEWRAAPGSTVTLKAKIYNRGELPAKGITLKTAVPKSLAAKVKPIKIKSLVAGKPVTKKIRVKVKRSAKAGSRLKIGFTVSAKSAKSGKATRSLQIR